MKTIFSWWHPIALSCTANAEKSAAHSSTSRGNRWMMFARNNTPAKMITVQTARRSKLRFPARPGTGSGIPIGAATVRERLPRRNRAPRPETIPLAITGSSPIEKGQPLPAALLPPTFLRNTSVPVHYRSQRRSEALRFLLHARRFQRAIKHQRSQTGHGAGAQPLTLVAYRPLSGGEILQAEQRQFETVFHANFLEKAREVYLYRALGDHQRGGDFLVLQTLREKAYQLAFALRQRHPARAQEAVGQRFLEPQLAGLDLLQAFHLQFRGQGLAQNATHA